MKKILLTLSLIGALAILVFGQNALVREITCTDAGANDTYTCSATVAPSAYSTSVLYKFLANTANTGAATFNLNSLGAKTIKKVQGGVTTDLADNDIRAAQWVLMVYDGTNMQMVSQLGNVPSGSGTPSPAANGLVACTGTSCSGAAARTFTAAAGLAGSNLDGVAGNPSLNTDSTEADFLASGALTCGAATQGKIKVHTTAIQYCDNSATPTLRYGAYADSAGNASTANELAGLSTTGVVKRTGPGAFLAAVAGTDYTTPTSTETQTNKGYDAEGTGNTLTIPVKVWLLAAGCNNATAAPMWDLPTSTPAVAACVTGTNIQKGVLQYADTSGGFSAQNTLILPADFTGAIDARIIWRTSATTGNVKFSLSTICTDVAASATDDPAFNTASTVTTAAAGTTLRVQVSSIAGVTATGCTAGSLLHLKLFRDGNDAADTISASLDVIGVEVTIRRSM